jgi:hypothetical protein
MKGTQVTNFQEDYNLGLDSNQQSSIYEPAVNGLLTNEHSAALWELFEKRPFCLHWKYLPQPPG